MPETVLGAGDIVIKNKQTTKANNVPGPLRVSHLKLTKPRGAESARREDVCGPGRR